MFLHKKFLFSIFLLSALLIAPRFVFASELYLGTAQQDWQVGDQTQFTLYLSAPESINAVEGKIIFPADILELKEIKTGDSVINLWAEQPQLDKDGEIIFSGITPGGYQGDGRAVFSMIFSAKKAGAGSIIISEAKALKNDGKGTDSQAKISNFQFAVVAKSSTSKPVILNDLKNKNSLKPEVFQPEINRSSEIFNNQWFLAFNAVDKNSGLASYEIKEVRPDNIFSIFKTWQKASSPYELKDQKLKSYIFVKAINNAGGERIVKISPINKLSWYENYLVFAIILLVIFISLFIIALTRRHEKNKF